MSLVHERKLQALKLYGSHRATGGGAQASRYLALLASSMWDYSFAVMGVISGAVVDLHQPSCTPRTVDSRTQ